jgi:hypothetical protein
MGISISFHPTFLRFDKISLFFLHLETHLERNLLYNRRKRSGQVGEDSV